MKGGRDLPEGWTTAIFDELLDYIQPTEFIVATTDYDDNYATPVLTPGKSFIIGYTNETTGIFKALPVIIFDDFTTATKFVNSPFKVKSSAMKMLTPTCSLVDIKYAFYFMQTIQINTDTHKRYWISVYSKKQIPLAPQNEQARIVSKIEELFSEIDKGVENFTAARNQLKVYRQALLKHAFEGRLTEQWRKENAARLETAEQLLDRIKEEREKRYQEQLEAWEKADKQGSKPKAPKHLSPLTAEELAALPELPEGWGWCYTDQLFSFVTSGSRGWAQYYSDEGAIFLRIGNLDHDSIYLDLSDIQRVRPPKGAEGTRTRVRPNDILISITADVGMIAVIPENIDEAYINQHISLVRPIGLTTSKYIAWFLASRKGQKQFHELQRGATKVGLGLDDIRSINIPLPPLAEQMEIISQVEQGLNVIDEMEKMIDSNLKLAVNLRQSILKNAFSGQLVSQDQNDEPASLLLERIRAERSAEMSVK